MTALNTQNVPRAFSTTLFESATLTLSGASLQVNGTAGTGTQALSPAPTTGLVRVRVFGGGSSDVATALLVQLTDGTITATIGSVPSVTIANQASSGIDMTFPFTVNFFPTLVNISTTLTGTTKTASATISVLGNHAS